MIDITPPHFLNLKRRDMQNSLLDGTQVSQDSLYNLKLL